MSITIENPEAEALLNDLSVRTRRSQPDLLLDLLRRERERLERERAEAVAEGLRVDEELRRRWSSRPLIDPRPVDEILAYDENGLPV